MAPAAAVRQGAAAEQACTRRAGRVVQAAARLSFCVVSCATLPVTHDHAPVLLPVRVFCSQVRDEIIENVEATYKETDLFKMLQTGDLANMDALPAEQVGGEGDTHLGCCVGPGGGAGGWTQHDHAIPTHHTCCLLLRLLGCLS